MSTITITSLLNLYREAGLPVVVNLKKQHPMGASAAYHQGKKIEVYKMESEHSTDFLREVLVHEFVHHLQYNKDHPDQYLPVSEKRDPTPCSQESEVFQAYWESPIEQEARYYESHPRKFDILVQKHGYSPLEWESVEVTLPILPSLVATVAVIATVAVGVFSYTLGEKVGILKGDNQFLRKENYELIQKLDKHDPCAYISSAEEKENCNLR